MFKKLVYFVCCRYEPIARYVEITRPIKKISKALQLTGYTPEQAHTMAIKIVWNTPSTGLNAMKYAERHIDQFCDEYKGN